MESGTWKLLLAEEDETESARIQAWFAEGSVHAELKQVAAYDTALELLGRNDATAALVEYRLGGNRGPDLVRAAVAKGCKVPLILLAEAVTPEMETRAREAGAADCLPKPQLTPLLLDRVIRYAVERSQFITMVRELTIHDELTGLFNMRELRRLLLEEIARSQRYGRHISLVLIDIDRFDDINTAYGHIAGDKVLQYVAQFLRDKVRSLDRIARYGGDEFAILLPETFSSEAFDMTERLRHISARPFVTAQGKQIPLSFSLGVAELPGDADVSDGLIERALEALHVAKKRGGNCTVQYYTLKGSKE
jgi:two-component system, cell cycle response regulator